LARVLIFRPNFDTATRYGHAWLGEVLRIAEGFGHEVLDLEGVDATPENFIDAMENFSPDIVIALGHGNATTFTGQNRRIVMRACENDDIMMGSQAYFLSCLMGQQLAPSMNEKDARAVAAYTAEYVWVIHPEYVERPLEDPRAYPFMRAIVESCRVLLAGGSWRDFYDTHTRLCNLGISEWFESEDPLAPQIVASLEHDRDSMTVYGEAAVRPAMRLPPIYTSFMPIPLGIIVISLFLP